MMIKICGIVREQDAAAAVAAGASALGFNFYPTSPRYVTLTHAQALSRSVPGNYLKVGVFVNPALSTVLEALDKVPLDVVQVHGAHLPVLPSHVRVWRAIAPASAPPPNVRAEAFLLDTPSAQFGGSGVSFSWEIAANFPGQAILAGGLHPGNVGDAIRLAQPWGVDACSRLESEPGIKDHALVRAFVHNAVSARLQLPIGSSL